MTAYKDAYNTWFKEQEDYQQKKAKWDEAKRQQESDQVMEIDNPPSSKDVEITKVVD